MKDCKQEMRGDRRREIEKSFWSGQLGLTLVTASLVVFIFLIVPMQKAGLPARMVFDVVIVTLMIWGVMDVSEDRMTMTVAILAVIATVVVLWITVEHPTAALHKLTCVLLITVRLIYARVLLLVVFRRGMVTWGRVQGGVAAYLLIGMAWAPAYQLVELIKPGSFHFASAPDGANDLPAKLLYFSFSTLTTVGFGDVTPLEPFARSLAIAEATVGQLFPAILIGALVAMAMQKKEKSGATHAMPLTSDDESGDKRSALESEIARGRNF